MKYEYLRHFHSRMKIVGVFTKLIINNTDRSKWKKYNFETIDEQINVIFVVLLFIMEQTLKDVPCLMDDIAAHLDTVNMEFFHHPMNVEDCKDLASYIINDILSKNGEPQYFKGFNFNTGQYEEIYIGYIQNKIVEINNNIKRTSYYLSDDGYQLLFATYEIEDNMQLNVQELIFKLHLEKADYDKAAEDIKSIFKIIHRQIKLNEDAIEKIRKNALNYSPEEFEKITKRNFEILVETKQKFQLYHEQVQNIAKSLSNDEINLSQLEESTLKNIAYLNIIEQYLLKVINEHQNILSINMELTAIYAKEIEQLSQMAIIERIDFRRELDEKLLSDVTVLKRLPAFYNALFINTPDKIYNINMALQSQLKLKQNDDEEAEIVSFSEEEAEMLLLEEKKRKLAKYHASLEVLLEITMLHGRKTTLSEIISVLEEDLSSLIPEKEIFQFLMIKLLKQRIIDIDKLREKQKTELYIETYEFNLMHSLLSILDAHPEWGNIRKIFIQRLDETTRVIIPEVNNNKGSLSNMICSDLVIQLLEAGEELCYTI